MPNIAGNRPSWPWRLAAESSLHLRRNPLYTHPLQSGRSSLSLWLQVAEQPGQFQEVMGTEGRASCGKRNHRWGRENAGPLGPQPYNPSLVVPKVDLFRARVATRGEQHELASVQRMKRVRHPESLPRTARIGCNWRLTPRGSAAQPAAMPAAPWKRPSASGSESNSPPSSTRPRRLSNIISTELDRVSLAFPCESGRAPG